jgi:hypothetical protein
VLQQTACQGKGDIRGLENTHTHTYTHCLSKRGLVTFRERARNRVRERAGNKDRARARNRDRERARKGVRERARNSDIGRS